MMKQLSRIAVSLTLLLLLGLVSHGLAASDGTLAIEVVNTDTTLQTVSVKDALLPAEGGIDSVTNIRVDQNPDALEAYEYDKATGNFNFRVHWNGPSPGTEILVVLEAKMLDQYGMPSEATRNIPITITLIKPLLRELNFAEAELIKTPGDATFTNPLTGYTADIKYTSANEAVATVDPVTGAVTVHSVGTATIGVWAFAESDPRYESDFASYNLVVTDNAVDATQDFVILFEQVGGFYRKAFLNGVSLTIAEDGSLSGYPTDSTDVIGILSPDNGSVTLTSAFLQTLTAGNYVVEVNSQTDNGGGFIDVETLTFGIPAAEEPEEPEPDLEYTITIDVTGMGSVTPDGGTTGVVTKLEGESQRFDFAAAEGYKLVDVLVDGVTVGTDASYEFTDINANHTLEVVFVVELNKEDHFAYIVGYDTGDFKPGNSITRAETAVMFSRLLAVPMDDTKNYTHSFSDMSSSNWYENAVAYMAGLGVITGYEDGTFRGDATITRAEFATIASRFDNLAKTNENRFSDVSNNHWAVSFINSAATKGWISGYPDGTFKPNSAITRAEAVTLVNRVLERSADMDYVETNILDIKRFPDVPEDHWAYANVIEATNGHEYVKETAGSIEETWTGLS